jgi:hypothetical protein
VLQSYHPAADPAITQLMGKWLSADHRERGMEKVFPRTYWLRGRAFGSFSELRESRKMLNESVDKKDTQGIGLQVELAKKQKRVKHKSDHEVSWRRAYFFQVSGNLYFNC